MKKCCKCKETLGLDNFSYYRYTTGGGNLSMRYDSRCKECNRIAVAERRKSPERALKDTNNCKMWREKNKAIVSKYAKEYRNSENGRKNRAASQASRYARLKQVSDSEPDNIKIIAIYKEARNLTDKLSNCVASDDPLEIVMHVDHVVPLSKGGLHHSSNLRIVSARENLTKSNKF